MGALGKQADGGAVRSPGEAGGQAGVLGSLSGASRRSCEEVPVRRVRQMARVGASRCSGVGVLTAGLPAALTPLPRRDGACSRARSPRVPSAACGLPGCVSGRPLAF